MNAITPSALREVLLYHQNGTFTWRHRLVDMFAEGAHGGAIAAANSWNARFAGQAALATFRNGYLCGRIFGTTMAAHRVGWAMHYGEWPALDIDHADRDRSNNRISNLRLASRLENARNSTSRRGSSSRFLGVDWQSRRGKWRARIRVGGRLCHIGVFDNEQEAADAYDAASLREFGQFANPNHKSHFCHALQARAG